MNVNVFFIIAMFFIGLNSSSAQDRFWVGNSGNWNDTSHWSLTSGGAGGASIPTSNNNAIFDSNSFSTMSSVTLDNNEHYCLNLDFSGIDEQVDIISSSLTSSDILVSGDLMGNSLLDAQSTFNYDIILVGNGTKNIFPSSTSWPRLYINNNNIVVELMGNIEAYRLELLNGTFDSNEKNLIVDFCYLRDNGHSFANFSNSMITSEIFSNELDRTSLTMTGSEITTSSMSFGADADFEEVNIQPGPIYQTINALNNINGSVNTLNLFNTDDLSISNLIIINQTLNIEKGSFIQLNFGAHLDINGTINQIGTCQFTSIQGSSSSSLGTIDLSSSQSLNELILSNLTSIGAGQFTATNSLDNGNVTGVQFTTGTINDIYWIGGTGDFDDLSHFSSSSGGPANLSCLPSAYDNVIFDSNSGLNSSSVINFPVGLYLVHDLHFIDPFLSCIFTSTGTTINNKLEVFIYGDLILSNNVTFDHTDNRTWLWNVPNEGNHIIDTKEIDIFNLIAKKENSTIELLSTIVASNEIKVTHANLITNGHDISCLSFNAKGTCTENCIPSTLDFGGSIIECQNFNSTQNDGLLTIMGDFKLLTSSARIGQENMDTVVLYDHPENILPPSIETDGVIDELIIDTELEAEIRDDIIIQGNLTIAQTNGLLLSPFTTNSTMNIMGNFILNNSSICGDLLIINNTKSFDYTIDKASGLFTVENCLITNVKTAGNAIFEALNSIVLVTANEWDNITAPTSINYYWIGGSGHWDDPSNWSNSSGGSPNTSGCLPTLKDNVIFDNSSFTANNSFVSIPSNFTAASNVLFWNATNYSNVELRFLGNQNSDINIFSGFYLNDNMNIVPGTGNSINVLGTDVEFDSRGKSLPNIKINDATISLLSPLSCHDFNINKGTLFTNNFDITTSGSFTITPSNLSNSIVLEFGSSTLDIAESFDLFGSQPDQVEYNAEMATIICGSSIDIQDGNIKELKFTNDIIIPILKKEHYIQRLVLAGEQHVDVGFMNISTGQLTVDKLVFEHPNAGLKIKDTDGITVNDSIISNYSTAFLMGEGGIKKVQLSKNLCVNDPLTFSNLVIEGGRINAPSSIDAGGNTGIDFNTYVDQGNLYWIGGTGTWDDEENWSFGSGACPAGTGAISIYDTLIFDDNSFAEGQQEIFFPGNRTAETMLFKNANQEAILNLPFRFRPDRIYIDGGKLRVKDLSINGNRELHVYEEVHIINGGELTLDTVTMQTGLVPSLLDESTFKIDSGCSLNANFSIITINGHGTGVNEPTVNIHNTASVEADDSLIKTFPPFNGEPQNDMTFKLNNSIWNKFVLDNIQGTNQMIILDSDLTINDLNLIFGTLKIKDGNMITILD